MGSEVTGDVFSMTGYQRDGSAGYEVYEYSNADPQLEELSQLSRHLMLGASRSLPLIYLCSMVIGYVASLSLKYDSKSRIQIVFAISSKLAVGYVLVATLRFMISQLVYSSTFGPDPLGGTLWGIISFFLRWAVLFLLVVEMNLYLTAVAYIYTLSADPILPSFDDPAQIFDMRRHRLNIDEKPREQFIWRESNLAAPFLVTSVDGWEEKENVAGKVRWWLEFQLYEWDATFKDTASSVGDYLNSFATQAFAVSLTGLIFGFQYLVLALFATVLGKTAAPTPLDIWLTVTRFGLAAAGVEASDRYFRAWMESAISELPRSFAGPSEADLAMSRVVQETGCICSRGGYRASLDHAREVASGVPENATDFFKRHVSRGAVFHVFGRSNEPIAVLRRCLAGTGSDAAVALRNAEDVPGLLNGCKQRSNTVEVVAIDRILSDITSQEAEVLLGFRNVFTYDGIRDNRAEFQRLGFSLQYIDKEVAARGTLGGFVGYAHLSVMAGGRGEVRVGSSETEVVKEDDAVMERVSNAANRILNVNCAESADSDCCVFPGKWLYDDQNFVIEASGVSLKAYRRGKQSSQVGQSLGFFGVFGGLQ